MKHLYNLFIASAIVIPVAVNSQTTDWHANPAGNTLTGGTSSTPNEWIGSNNNYDLILKTNNVEQIRIKSGGNGFINGTLGIGTSSPDLDSKVHIVTPMNTSNQGVKGIYITNPSSFGSANGSITALQATGGATSGKAKATSYTATLGQNSTWANVAGIIGGVSGGISGANYIQANAGNTSYITGINGSVGATSLQFASTGTMKVTGLWGAISGTLFNFPTSVGSGYIAAIAGEDGINATGAANSTQYTYAGWYQGRVRIGTATGTQYIQKVGTTHADYLLCVDGKIVARKMVTTLQNWADDEFNVPASFDELEKEKEFVEQNKHLRSVPSEKEVLENGVEMGEMFPIQMRKIEQLFKYSFMFGNEMKQLKEENEMLKKQISELSKRIELLEK